MSRRLRRQDAPLLCHVSRCEGDVVPVVPCRRLTLWCAALVALTAVNGCGLTGKKATAPVTPPMARGPTEPRSPALPAGRPSGSATAPVQPASATAGFTGILAGQVVDGLHSRLPPTYIQVTPARDGATPPLPPFEVETDASGYFTIERLQQGRSYQLLARTRSGDRVLAGTTWATPPNPRVLIQVSEEFASPSTPPAPGAPAFLGPEPPRPNSIVKPGSPAGASVPAKAPAAQPAPHSWAPQSESAPAVSAPQRGADLGVPIKLNEQNTAPAPAPIQVRPQDKPHIINVPASRSDAAAPTAAVPDSLVRPPVPSCSLSGTQLYNFALYDVNGQPWEFRQHRGRLVLLDFWGTWCGPCRDAIPHLRILHDTYGAHGLEVVGIDYENETGLSAQEQAMRVKRVRQRLNINYRLLLGGEPEQCPVHRQFAIRSYPTLCLLDSDGRILSRYEGLRQNDLKDLEMQIRQRLFGAGH